MRIGKLMGKNVFLSMIVCSITSFSLLHADNLKECESEEDKKAGCVEKAYYDSGDLTMERPYKNGTENGVAKEYYDNGNLMLETPYKNGKREGMGKRYYESGNIHIEKPFKNDTTEGIEKHYYESGDILAEIPYTNGIVKFYNKEKDLIWQATAQNGKLTSGKCSTGGKVMTNAHLTRLAKEINVGISGNDY